MKTATIKLRKKQPKPKVPPGEDSVHELVRKFRALLEFSERNTCLHEETHRGGAIWTICDQCGAKWADDRGGVPDDAHDYPMEIREAREALDTFSNEKITDQRPERNPDAN